MGQAKLRGSFEQRKELAEFHINEKDRYQRWLRIHKPKETKETKEQRNASTALNLSRAMSFGSGLLFLN